MSYRCSSLRLSIGSPVCGSPGSDPFSSEIVNGVSLTLPQSRLFQLRPKNRSFSMTEKETALPLYRCLKPLAFTKLYRVKALGEDRAAVRAFLDKTEHYLTAPIDFAARMAPSL